MAELGIHYFYGIMLCLTLLASIMSYANVGSKVLCVLLLLGGSILGVGISGSIMETEISKNIMFDWLKYGQVEFKISILLDELSISIITFLQVVGFLMSMYFLVQKKSFYKYEASLFYLLIFAFSILSAAENFVTFVITCVACGYIFNLMHVEFCSNRNNKRPLFLLIVYRISNVMMIVGLMGLLGIFQTGSFSAFKAQEVVANISMKNYVVVYSLLIVFSFFIRWLHVPVSYYVSHLNKAGFSTSLCVSWSLQVIAGVIIASRLAVVFVSFEEIIVVVIWLSAITIVCVGGLALVQETVQESFSYIIVGVSSFGFVMCFLGQFDDVIFYIFSILIGIIMISQMIEIFADIKTVPHKKTIRPPVSGMIYSIFSMLLIIGIAGSPSYFSMVEMIRGVSASSNIAAYCLLIVGWFTLGIAISKICIASFILMDKSLWDRNYDINTKLTLFLCSVSGVLIFVLKYVNLSTLRLINFSAFINRAVLTVEAGHEYYLGTYIALGILGIIPPITIYYLYVVRLNDNLAKKVEDSFPAIYLCFKKNLYLEEALTLAFVTIPQKLSRLFLVLVNKLIPRLLITAKKGSIFTFTKILAVECEDRIDGIIAMISFCVVLVLAVIMMKFIM